MWLTAVMFGWEEGESLESGPGRTIQAGGTATGTVLAMEIVFAYGESGTPFPVQTDINSFVKK